MLLPWIVTLGLLTGTAAYVFWPSEPELRSPVKPGRDGALIWGDGVFANALELEAWLRIRGVSYRQWARKHPAAVKLLAPGPKPATPVKAQAKATPKPAPAKAKAKATPAAKETVAAPPATPAAAGSEGGASLAWDPVLLGVLALLAVLGGALMTGLSRLSPSSQTIEFPFGVAVSAAAVGIAFALASFLT
ncbi:MAG: hypothetical protein ABIR67_07925 [Gaiellaceae bacterium]